MPKFSEAEVFLLQNWANARVLESSMEAIRAKYKGLVDEALEVVTKNHRELDCSKRLLNATFGIFCVGKAKWPKARYDWPSGFYLEDLRLENLTSPEENRPYKNVWVYDCDQDGVEKRLRKAAEGIVGEEESRRWEFESVAKVGWAGAGLWTWLEPREDLLKLLLQNESRGFTDSLVAHFEQMAKFTSAVDEILKTTRRRDS
jgi:hypothetical protein